MKTFLALIALVAFQFATAQKTQVLNDVKTITVSDDVILNLVKGTENKLVFESDEHEIDVKYDKDNLVLGGDGTATLYYKNEFEGITISGDAAVKGKDEIKGQFLSVTADSDSRVELKLNVTALTVAAAGDASITFTGKADKIRATLADDAKIDAKDFNVEDAVIVATSDAEATIKAKGVVDAVLSDEAKLNVYGNPKKVNETKTDDATVTIVR